MKTAFIAGATIPLALYLIGDLLDGELSIRFTLGFILAPIVWGLIFMAVYGVYRLVRRSSKNIVQDSGEVR